jgi:hypothetical protein
MLAAASVEMTRARFTSTLSICHHSVVARAARRKAPPERRDQRSWAPCSPPEPPQWGPSCAPCRVAIPTVHRRLYHCQSSGSERASSTVSGRLSGRYDVSCVDNYVRFAAYEIPTLVMRCFYLRGRHPQRFLNRVRPCNSARGHPASSRWRPTKVPRRACATLRTLPRACRLPRSVPGEHARRPLPVRSRFGRKLMRVPVQPPSAQSVRPRPGTKRA